MHWFLILTIFTDNGSSISQAGPFVNKDNCNKAANKWLIEVKNLEIPFNLKRLSAICVQR